jgi:hypothetical protein
MFPLLTHLPLPTLPTTNSPDDAQTAFYFPFKFIPSRRFFTLSSLPLFIGGLAEFNCVLSVRSRVSSLSVGSEFDELGSEPLVGVWEAVYLLLGLLSVMVARVVEWEFLMSLYTFNSNETGKWDLYTQYFFYYLAICTFTLRILTNVERHLMPFTLRILTNVERHLMPFTLTLRGNSGFHLTNDSWFPSFNYSALLSTLINSSSRIYCT